MTMYKNRAKLSGASATVGRIFGPLGLSANAWTLIGLLLSFVTAYFIVMQDFLFAAVLFAVTAFIDVIDGAVARYRKEASPTGAYNDTIIDRYAEGVVVVSLLFVSLPSFYVSSQVWTGAFLFGAMMTTYVKAAAKEKLNKEVTGGLLERPERMILLFLGIAAAYFSPLYLTYAIILLAVLSNITAVQRIVSARKIKGL